MRMDDGHSKRRLRGIMQKTDHSISMAKANFYSLPIVILSILILIVPYLLIWGTISLYKGFIYTYLNLKVLIPVLLSGALLHETLHGLSFLVFGKLNIKQIKIGFQWKTITPFAHCKVPVKAKIYRIALIVPALLLGIVPAIIALITGTGWLIIYGIIFTIVGGGDFLTIWIIRKAKKDQLVQDHPHNCGCWVYEESTSS